MKLRLFPHAKIKVPFFELRNYSAFFPTSNRNENVLYHCICIVHLTGVDLRYCEPKILFYQADLKFCRVEDGKYLQHSQRNLKIYS